MMNAQRLCGSLQIFREKTFRRGIGYCLYRLLMSEGDSQITELFGELTQLSENLSYSK